MALAVKQYPSPLSINAALSRLDPTKTLMLRNRWARDFLARFARLKTAIRRAIVERDCFGLVQTPGLRIVTMDAAVTLPHLPAEKQFAFPRSADKVKAFMEWLSEQEAAGLLETARIPQLGSASEEPWTDLYIQDSYSRGVQRARYELGKAGYLVPAIEMSGGISTVMSLPFHVDRVGLLYSRTFSDLQGITAAMDTQISRILSQGMVDGDNPRLLAKKLIAAIDGQNAGTLGITDTLGRFIPAERRAEMLARTEVIRAFAESSLVEYAAWGVTGLNVLVEFVNAGYAVCPRCQDLTRQYANGIPIDQASGIIPVHPNCRCCWIPREAPRP